MELLKSVTKLAIIKHKEDPYEIINKYFIFEENIMKGKATDMWQG